MDKKLHFKSLLLIVALLLGGGISAFGAPDVIWSEDFSSYTADAVPNGGVYSYACTDGTGTSPGSTKVMNEKLATGTAPELMVGKKGSTSDAVPNPVGGTFTAVIPLDNYEGTLTLTYYQNKNTLKVSSTTVGVSGGQTLKPSQAGQQTTTFTGITKEMTSITIVFEATTTSNVRLDNIVLTGNKASSVATPVFDPAEGTYASGQNVTLSCATEGTTIYYTMGDNPADPTSESTAYTGAIAVNVSTTIKAIAINGSNASQVASATYTILPITHAGTQEDPYTVADARNAIDANTGVTGVYVKGIVCTGGSNLQDGAMNYWISDDGTQTNKLEAYKGKNIGDTNFEATTDVNINDVVVVYGNLTKYNTTYEFAAGNTLISIEESAIPLINAENSLTIDFDATSGEIDYTIDNPTDATLTATITEGDWISNIGYVEGKVTFSATANTGDQRTAKITLSYTGAEDKVVTITQEANGIATIPFAFDGGKADIEKTYGLAHSGLGNNYSSAPKLKFDGNGDFVTLRFNEAVDRLVFDIKGNDFSKGSTSTFKVQKSANGTDYEDLDTYTELGDKVTKVYELSSSVRYIKWTYTEKGADNGGNVALGNIRLENAGPSVTIGESKFATFAYTDAVDFSGTGVTAYTAKVEEGVVKLTAIAGNVVPANTGVIIAANGAAEYTGFITTGGSVGDNELVGITAETAVSYSDGEKYNYILQNGAFYKANGATLRAGRAYLHTKFDVTATTESRLTIVVDGETTGIKTVKGDSDEQSVYDLQGRKVAQPVKGLYITNGRKFIVK